MVNFIIFLVRRRDFVIETIKTASIWYILIYIWGFGRIKYRGKKAYIDDGTQNGLNQLPLVDVFHSKKYTKLKQNLLL